MHRDAAIACRRPDTQPPDTSLETPPMMPAIRPDERDPSTVLPASTYRRNQAVWAYVRGKWRPGSVDLASDLAIALTYETSSPRGGTAVDTFTDLYVMPRDETEPEPHDPGS